MTPVLLSLLLLAQPASMLVDTDTQPDGTFRMFDVDGVGGFAIGTRARGERRSATMTELWRVDRNGGFRVRALDPLFTGGAATMATSFDGAAVALGGRLFLTDGFSATRVQLPEGVAINSVAQAGLGGVSFAGSAHFDAFGSEPYLITSTGLFVEMPELTPGPLGSFPRDFRTLERGFVFAATDQVGPALFRLVDGMSAPTVLARFSGSLSVLPTTGGRALVRDSDGTYVTDGASVTWVSGAKANNSAMLDDRIAFVGFVENGVQRLFITDGTVAGTSTVVDLNLSSGSAIGATQNQIYFEGTDDAGRELWISEGTAASTRRVADLDPAGDASPRAFTWYDDKMFFVADVDREPRLFVTQGSADTTVELYRGQTVRHTASGGLLFLTLDGVLWHSDGTASGTGPVPLEQTATAGGHPVASARRDGTGAWFLSETASAGSLWSTDGTVEGTQEAHRFTEGLPSSAAVLGDRVLSLVELVAARRLQIWVTEAGQTRMLAELPNADLWKVERAGGALFIDIVDRLVVTDGSEEGTREMGGLRLLGTYAGAAVAVEGEGESAAAVLIDASAQLTHLFDMPFGAIGHVPVLAVEDRLYVQGQRALYVWDGLRVDERADAPAFRHLAVVEGVVFGADDDALHRIDPLAFVPVWRGRVQEMAGAGRRLFFTDGEALRVLDAGVVQDLPGARPMALAGYQGLLLFSAYTEETGRELWVSRGDAISTHLLSDSVPGPESGGPDRTARFVEAGEHLLYPGYHPRFGMEPWVLPLSVLGLDPTDPIDPPDPIDPVDPVDPVDPTDPDPNLDGDRLSLDADQCGCESAGGRGAPSLILIALGWFGLRRARRRSSR